MIPIDTQAYTDAERRHFLRYTRTRQWPMLGRFPVSDELHSRLLAEMLHSTPEVIGRLTTSLADEVHAAAAHLLSDAAYRDDVGRLPYLSHDRVVAVGDSITADRLGWFELLAASVEATAATGPTLVNLGVSGNTTADVLERFDLLEASGPTRVLLMLGTNDAREHGRAGRHRMVTPPETERNLRTLVDLVTGELGADVTLITPPPVDQLRVDAFFDDAPVHWHAGAVDEVAAVVRKVSPGAIDLHTAVRPISPDLLEADGVHPSVAGQRAILRYVVQRLALSDTE